MPNGLTPCPNSRRVSSKCGWTSKNWPSRCAKYQGRREAAASQLAADLENLSKGQAPGAFPLFQVLRQKLGNRVEQLGRLIEVKPEAERWWPALELFLARNRWVLVVNDPEDYRVAVEILRKTPPGREAESLLNPHEARQLRAGMAKCASSPCSPKWR
jgi:hypothetical protein